MQCTRTRISAAQIVCFLYLLPAFLFLSVLPSVIEAASRPGQATRRLSTNTNLGDASPVGSGRKVALLIGNADYGELGELSNPVNDVTAFSRALESLGFGVMTRTNCTKKEMSKAAQEFADKCRGSDVALFYFSGHGSQLKGENYLWPIKADAHSEADLEDECFRAQRMVDLMTEANARINIVILDACRTVPFKSGSRSGARGLAQMNSSSGQFLIAFATDPGTTASDGVAGTNSPYMTAILNNLNRPGLSLSEFFIEVRKEVKKLTNGQQRPWETACLEDRFFFNPSGSDTPSTPPVTSSSQQTSTTTSSSPTPSPPTPSPIEPRPSEYQVTTSEKAQSLVAEAEQLIAQNEFQKAKARAEEAIRLCPTLADAHFFLGVAYKKLNQQHLKSIPCFEAAIRHDPNHQRAYASLAYAYGQTGQTQKAIKTNLKAIEIDPQNALLYRNLANNYVESKQYRQALEYSRKAIELRPDYYEAYNLLGISLNHLNQMNQAVEAYEAAIRIDPTKARAYINLGAVYADLGQKKKAHSCYQKAMQCNPNAEEAKVLRNNMSNLRD